MAMAQFCFSNAPTCASITPSSASDDPSLSCSSAWIARPPSGFLPLLPLPLLLVDGDAGGGEAADRLGGGGLGPPPPSLLLLLLAAAGRRGRPPLEGGDEEAEARRRRVDSARSVAPVAGGRDGNRDGRNSSRALLSWPRACGGGGCGGDPGRSGRGWNDRAPVDQQ